LPQKITIGQTVIVMFIFIHTFNRKVQKLQHWQLGQFKFNRAFFVENKFSDYRDNTYTVATARKTRIVSPSSLLEHVCTIVSHSRDNLYANLFFFALYCSNFKMVRPSLKKAHYKVRLIDSY